MILKPKSLTEISQSCSWFSLGSDTSQLILRRLLENAQRDRQPLIQNGACCPPPPAKKYPFQNRTKPWFMRIVHVPLHHPPVLVRTNCKIPSSSGHNIMHALRQLTEVTLVVLMARGVGGEGVGAAGEG